jgi:hypothetical protein
VWFHSPGLRAIRPQLGLAIPRIGHPIGGHLGGWHRELETLHPITPICLPIRSQRRARRAQFWVLIQPLRNTTALLASNVANELRAVDIQRRVGSILRVG